MAKASELLPRDWLTVSNEHWLKLKPVSRTKRGVYCPGGRKAGELDVSKHKSEQDRIAAHELGHRTEHVVQGLLQRSLEFLRRRTACESPQKLRILFPGGGYKADEVTRVDAFAHAYMGKDHGESASEILSMGLEGLLFNSNELLKRDPEFADYILGALVAW